MIQTTAMRRNSIQLSGPEEAVLLPQADVMESNNLNFGDVNDRVNNLIPTTHHSGQKYRKHRGLSISTGVSYTNFYSRVGPNTPSTHFMGSSSRSEPIVGLRKISLWLKSINSKIILLCGAWYVSSVVSSNLTKTILRAYTYPVTLTEIQFFLTSVLCLITYVIVYFNRNIAAAFPLGTFPVQLTDSRFTSFYDVIRPTRLILTQTIPMGMFQFVGHLTSHNATSLISVSMVHTIKALSPIVTVLSYRFLFGVHYPSTTYITLCPLVVGIMLTCLFKGHKKGAKSLVAESSNYVRGLIFAFVSMLIFVSQNIFAKKIVTYKTNLLADDDSIYKAHQYTNILPVDGQEEARKRSIVGKKKTDKLTILFYCSIIGFIFTFPFYLSGELFSHRVFSLYELTYGIVSLMIVHGVVHFIQALLAFHILGLVSPVSYSIANIFKRIVVILAALLLEGQPLNFVQGIGLALTMTGLYCYDKWGSKR